MAEKPKRNRAKKDTTPPAAQPETPVQPGNTPPVPVIPQETKDTTTHAAQPESPAAGNEPKLLQDVMQDLLKDAEDDLQSNDPFKTVLNRLVSDVEQFLTTTDQTLKRLTNKVDAAYKKTGIGSSVEFMVSDFEGGIYPMAAIVCGVNADDTVNVWVFPDSHSSAPYYTGPVSNDGTKANTWRHTAGVRSVLELI